MEKLTKAKYLEWEASILGASILALGLGVVFAEYLRPFAAGVILVGILIHGWGMWKIHKRNQ